MGVFADLFVIAFMSPVVIWRRMFMFAQGGRAANKEGRLAVSEKLDLAAKSAASLASGGSWRSVVRNYREKVQANARRL